MSLALAGVFLRLAGIGLNTMTLGGLAIAVGLLVDAAIIVAENVVHRLSAHPTAERRARALAAVLEVGRPIAFATAIVVAVFVPLFAMTGIEGRMYAPLAGAVIAAMLASLVLALALVPVLAAALLRPRRPDRPEDVALIRAIKRGYRPLLDGALRHAGWVRLGTLAVTVPALWLATQLGSDFMPELDEGAVLMQTSLPAEASLDEVDRLNHRVEDVLRAFPEVEDVVRRTGRGEHTEDPMPHTLSDVLIVLRPDRARSTAALEAAMREAVEPIPGLSASFTTRWACASTRAWAARRPIWRCGSSAPTWRPWASWPSAPRRSWARSTAWPTCAPSASTACPGCGSRSIARPRRGSG